MTRLDRYQADTTNPGVKSALGDMVKRAWLPGLAWGVLMTLGGLLLMGPLRRFTDNEISVNKTSEAMLTTTRSAETVNMMRHHLGKSMSFSLR